MTSVKPILLTGDTPTGKLHLGHWVGSLENRVRMQADHQCFFLLANMHAFTTRVEDPAAIRQSVLDIVLDYLSVGIDPQQSTIFVETDVPAIYELTAYFSMLISYPRLMRNPTIKDEIRDKNLGDHYSVGFLLYPVMQVADILAFRPNVVPVGEDQIPHLEMTREVARRFNQLYCDDPEKGLFPIFETKVGRVKRLIGLGGPNEQGQLLKMSKSLNNAILLSDDPDTIRKKVMSIYTDPNRIRASDPGNVENNPLWIFHETFNADQAWVAEAKERYRQGNIGDVECKKKLADILIALLEPIRERRKQFDDPQLILNVLREGAEKANAVAEKTLKFVKEVMQQLF